MYKKPLFSIPRSTRVQVIRVYCVIKICEVYDEKITVNSRIMFGLLLVRIAQANYIDFSLKIVIQNFQARTGNSRRQKRTDTMVRHLYELCELYSKVIFI